MNALRARGLKIAELNDALRTRCASAEAVQHGQVMITRGVSALDSVAVEKVLRAVAAFDAFSADNDPYGEHDFGSLTVADNTIFWKIDAYQKGSNYLSGADTPENPTATDRILTIMLAEEY